MSTSMVTVSTDVMDEFRHLVYQKYQKFGYLRTEADRAIIKHIEILKQELAEKQEIPA